MTTPTEAWLLGQLRAFRGGSPWPLWDSDLAALAAHLAHAWRQHQQEDQEAMRRSRTPQEGAY